MNYCFQCGTKLINKQCKGQVPYCRVSKCFVSQHLVSAISAIVLNPDKNKVLLIQQYGKKYIICSINTL